MAVIVIASKSCRVAEIMRGYIRRVRAADTVVIAPEWEVLKRCIRDERPRLIFIESNFFHCATAYMVSLLLGEKRKLRVAVFGFELLSEFERGAFYSLGARGVVDLREDESVWGKCVTALLAGEEERCPALVRGMDAARMVEIRNPALTLREMQIVRLVCAGRSNEEIGGILGIHDRSIKNYKTHIYEKCGVRNNVQLVHLAVYMGWIELGEMVKVVIRSEEGGSRSEEGGVRSGERGSRSERGAT
jgi:DNA-binding CsgD family transcriptional regulator